MLKTKDVQAHDRIRVLRVAGSAIFRDGMTVGEFVRGARSVDAGLRVLARNRRLGVIGFVDGGEAGP